MKTTPVSSESTDTTISSDNLVFLLDNFLTATSKTFSLFCAVAGATLSLPLIFILSSLAVTGVEVDTSLVVVSSSFLLLKIENVFLTSTGATTAAFFLFFGLVETFPLAVIFYQGQYHPWRQFQMWQPREDYWNYIRKLLESVTSGPSNIKTDHSTISKVK